jgi:hypothetical protein
MLTQIYYYNFYKPYLVGGQGGRVAETPKRGRILDTSQEAREDSTFLLNKALRADVIRYAGNISASVNGVKESAKDVVYDMESFNTNVYRRGLPTARKWIGEDVSRFVAEYNQAVSFFENQEHSPVLREFSATLRGKIDDSLNRLVAVGISQNADDLQYDGKALATLSQDGVNIAIGETLDFFNRVYADSGEVLKSPLMDHMNFKYLGYYYNYKYGGMVADTFKIIEAGMLVDKVV